MKNNSTIASVTEKILSLMDKVSKGDIKYWIPLSGLAYNPVSKHTYSNLNQLLLSIQLYDCNYSHNNWMTFKQIKESGGHVTKGEKASIVTYSDMIYIDQDGERLTKSNAKDLLVSAKEIDSSVMNLTDIGISTRRFLKLYHVFNVAQTDGLPDRLVKPELIEMDAPESYFSVDALLIAHEVQLVHVAGNSAHYNPRKDKIQMPFPEQFESADEYCSTLFHELVHWTGHKTRLNRRYLIKDEDHYAFEELVAELGSAFLCAKLNIPASVKSSSAYIKSWLGKLQDDVAYILKANSYAQRAVNFVLNPIKVS